MALRVGFVAYSIAQVVYLSRSSDYRTYDRSIVAWELVAVIIASIIDATRPLNFIAHVIIITIFVFIIYLVIPTKLINQIVFSALLTVGEVLIIMLAVNTSIQSLYTVFFSLVLANVIAISTSWQFHAHRRHEYLGEQALVESRNRFQALFSSSNEGIALHELVRDRTAKPRTIGSLMSTRPSRSRPTFPGRCHGSTRIQTLWYWVPPYLDIYEKVARTGEPSTFDTYFPPMNKHFRISVFSPDRGQFATMFVDIRNPRT